MGKASRIRATHHIELRQLIVKQEEEIQALKDILGVVADRTNGELTITSAEILNLKHGRTITSHFDAKETSFIYKFSERETTDDNSEAPSFETEATSTEELNSGGGIEVTPGVTFEQLNDENYVDGEQDDLERREETLRTAGTPDDETVS